MNHSVGNLIDVSIVNPTTQTVEVTQQVVIPTTAFVEVLRLDGDNYGLHKVAWEFEADRPVDACIYDESERIYMTQGVSTPAGSSVGVHTGEADITASQFRLMARSADGLPVTIYRARITATDMHGPRYSKPNGNLDCYLLKARSPRPPFETVLDLMGASENLYKLSMGVGIPSGRLTHIVGGT